MQQQPSSTSQEYRFLPVTCPKCGFEGKVKIQKLDRSFTCRQCRRVFHLSLEGEVLGQRQAGLAVDSHDAYVKANRESWIIKKFDAIPRPIKFGAVGAIVLGAIYWLVVTLSAPKVVIPESLDERAILFARAVVRNDLATVKKLTWSESFKKAQEWVKSVRQSDWPTTLTDNDINVRVADKFRNTIRSNMATSDAECDAGLELVIQLPGATASAPASGASNAGSQSGLPSTQLLTFWKQKSTLEWRFDGERTAREARYK